MKYFYWNRIAMENKPHGFIQVENDEVGPEKGFYFVGEGATLEEGIEYAKQTNFFETTVKYIEDEWTQAVEDYFEKTGWNI